jgi:flagellar hook-length control protein FliK
MSVTAMPAQSRMSEAVSATDTGKDVPVDGDAFAALLSDVVGQPDNTRGSIRDASADKDASASATSGNTTAKDITAGNGGDATGDEADGQMALPLAMGAQPNGASGTSATKNATKGAADTDDPKSAAAKSEAQTSDTLSSLAAAAMAAAQMPLNAQSSVLSGADGTTQPAAGAQSQAEKLEPAGQPGQDAATDSVPSDDGTDQISDAGSKAQQMSFDGMFKQNSEKAVAASQAASSTASAETAQAQQSSQTSAQATSAKSTSAKATSAPSAPDTLQADITRNIAAADKQSGGDKNSGQNDGSPNGGASGNASVRGTGKSRNDASLSSDVPSKDASDTAAKSVSIAANAGSAHTASPASAPTTTDGQMAASAASSTATQTDSPIKLAVLPQTQNAQTNASALDGTSLDALAVRIAAKAGENANQFDIRLDPHELGRIDVHLDMNADGQSSAQLTVEKPQTLTLLQSDAGSLHRALRDAGIDLGNSGLSFSLKGEQQNGGQASGQQSRSRTLKIGAVSGATQSPGLIATSNWNTSQTGGDLRLDIRI